MEAYYLKIQGLTDEIITLIKRKYKDFVSLQPLNDHIETAARENLIKRFLNTPNSPK